MTAKKILGAPAVALLAALVSSSVLAGGACSSSVPSDQGGTSSTTTTATGAGGGDGGSDAPDCFMNPMTYVEIINACTTAQAVDVSPVLPLLEPDGGLPPLP